MVVMGHARLGGDLIVFRGLNQVTFTWMKLAAVTVVGVVRLLFWIPQGRILILS